MKTSLVFTGDISFDRHMAGRWDDPDLLDGELLSFLRAADHVIVNVEGPLLDGPPGEVPGVTSQFNHGMGRRTSSFLNRIGADIWSLCNNHSMDDGVEGLRCTLEVAADCGVRTIGAGMDAREAGKPIFLDEAGGIGIFAVGYQDGCVPAGEGVPGCFRWDAMEEIEKRIRSIKKDCRWCVMVVHGGEEFTALPSPYTRDRYLKYLELGADVVVGHHPHVPMNYERVGEKVIFYSIGNFVFDTDYQRAQHDTDTGILLRLNFTEEAYSFEPKAFRLIRDEGRIVPAPLPVIFEDIREEEYRLLLPLSVQAFLEASKRLLIYLRPDEFSCASEEKIKEELLRPDRLGRKPGEGLDFEILYPIAEAYERGDWKRSRHKEIVEYIRKQMQPVK